MAGLLSAFYIRALTGALPRKAYAIACRRTMFALVIALLTTSKGQPAEVPRMMMLPFSFFDTSGEPQDQKSEHAARLAALDRQIGDALQTRGFYHLVAPPSNVLSCQPGEEACVLAGARQAGTDLILTGAVQKASTLILQIWVGAFDAHDGKRLFYRQLSFRGDTDDAWQHAGAFLVQEIESDTALKP